MGRAPGIVSSACRLDQGLDGTAALNRDWTIDVVEFNLRATRADLAMQAVTDILPVVYGQSEVVGDSAMKRARFDLGVNT